MKEFINALNEAVTRLEKDIAAHEKYLSAAPSLEHHHYVAMIKPENSLSCNDWTVRLTCYGAQLQKNTTAENFPIFTTRAEAVAAAKKIRLVDADGKRVKHVYNIVTCTEWHKLMLGTEREDVERLEKILKDAKAKLAA